MSIVEPILHSYYRGLSSVRIFYQLIHHFWRNDVRRSHSFARNCYRRFLRNIEQFAPMSSSLGSGFDGHGRFPALMRCVCSNRRPKCRRDSSRANRRLNQFRRPQLPSSGGAQVTKDCGCFGIASLSLQSQVHYEMAANHSERQSRRAFETKWIDAVARLIMLRKEDTDGDS